MGKATFLVDMDGFDSGYGIYYRDREITVLKAYLSSYPLVELFCNTKLFFLYQVLIMRDPVSVADLVKH